MKNNPDSNTDWLKDTPKNWHNSIFVLLNNGEVLYVERGWICHDKRYIHIHETAESSNKIMYIVNTLVVEIEDVVLIKIQHHPSGKIKIFTRTKLQEPRYKK